MKKKALVTGMAAALVSIALVSAVNAQETDGDRGFSGRSAEARAFRADDVRAERSFRGREFGRRGRGGNLDRVFDRSDENEDGVVDESEFVDSRTRNVDGRFDRLDADDDGVLTREETEREHRPGRPEIDREEVIQCVRETIADYDPEGRLEAIFDTVDTNDDGYIDQLELSIYLQARAYALFDRIDTNDDGVISQEEAEAAHEAAINLRRVIRACIDEQLDPFTDDTDV